MELGQTKRNRQVFFGTKICKKILMMIKPHALFLEAGTGFKYKNVISLID
jgi:hypothetical protein